MAHLLLHNYENHYVSSIQKQKNLATMQTSNAGYKIWFIQRSKIKRWKKSLRFVHTDDKNIYISNVLNATGNLLFVVWIPFKVSLTIQVKAESSELIRV